MNTRTKIRRSMKEIPTLTFFGLGIPYGVKGQRHRSRKIRDEKARLLESEEQFEVVCDWLKDVDRTSEVNTRHTSYYLKHLAERCLGCYISNGVFIAAAINCGFKYQRARAYPNMLFNISEDSLNQKYKESLSYEKYPQEA